MKRWIILVLMGVVMLGIAGMYIIERGSRLFLKPPESPRIAFVSNRDGKTDVWTMKSDGSDLRRVTDDVAEDHEPVWSPDAREIASISDRLHGVFQVIVSAWNGNYSECLTISSGTKGSPVWSSDGRQLAYTASGKVFVKDRDGGEERQCVPPSVVPGAGMIPQMTLPVIRVAWSPGNRALMVIRETDAGQEVSVFEGDTDDIANGEVVPNVIANARSLDAVWGPGGERLAIGFANQAGKNGLIVVDLETLETRELFVSNGDGNAAMRPSWSPDGRRICFELWQVVNGMLKTCKGIGIISAAGGNWKLVVEGDARHPSWSPDGKKIACEVKRPGGGSDIWSIRVDSRNRVNLTRGIGDNSEPAWSPLPK